MVIVLKNLSCKKQFIPARSTISNFEVKLMLPDGRELKRRNETLSLKDQTVVFQTITNPQITEDNTKTQLTFTADISNQVVPNIILKLEMNIG